MHKGSTVSTIGKCVDKHLKKKGVFGLFEKLLHLFYLEGVDEINQANKTTSNTSEACEPNTPKLKKSCITIDPFQESPLALAAIPARQGEVVE